MARPTSIQAETILAAARRVFMARGYGAGTALVAREAGVSQGSVFRHFKTKHALFMAAMAAETNVAAWRDRLAAAVGVADPAETLEAAGMLLLERVRTILPRVLLVRSSGITLAACGRRAGGPPAVQYARALAAYFRGEGRCGRLRMTDPLAQAHAFVGAIYHYVFCEVVHGYRPGPAARYVRSVVASLLGGSRADAARRQRRSRNEQV